MVIVCWEPPTVLKLEKKKRNGKFSHYEYYISGVSQLPHPRDFPDYEENPYATIKVPRKYSAIATEYWEINNPRRRNPIPKNNVFFDVANLWESNPCQQEQGRDPIGVPIHTHCWDIVERVIGPCRTSHDLERLVNVLYKQWTRKLFFGIDNCVKILNNRKIWDPVLPHRDPDATPCHPESWMPLVNPLDSKIVRRLLTGSIKESNRAERHQTLRSWRFCPQHLNYGKNIPLEIMYNILDHIQSTDDLVALKVLGWQAPDSYWLSRIPRDIFLELDEELQQLKSTVVVDWPFFCLKAERLMETSHSLLNRKRIFRIVGSVKSLLQKEDMSSFNR